ncbi:GtrA family protein (plasmid) [Ruegeria conchae]|uniref:GtrA family protein n=1 Tax=Ruegeria conchae TaxID=981384 RepID=UPI00147CC535|nr:GtrA family protein [Ruegeria conchae]UWR05109.1 GtrA family protein [Ruegeria conchae]
MTLGGLVLRYGVFAVIATIANLMTQRLVLHWGEGLGLFVIAMGAGTFVGLVIKYLLDKRWIFYDLSSGAAAHGKKFTLYTIMGLVTTVIFWGSETACWLFWKTDLAREIGAVIGLTIGYVVKYNLDRRYVFTDAMLSLRRTT